MWESYYRPRTLTEALEILEGYAGEARVIAGGTDLMLDLKKGTKKAKALVDIRSIEGLNTIEERGDKLFLGAGVTHSQVATCPLITAKARTLAEAASKVGSLQIRNVGTVVGNVINAQPAADTAVALVALEAEAEIVSLGSKEVFRVDDLYAGPGESKVDSTRSIVTGLYIPLKRGSVSTFQRIAWRRSLALPVVNMALVLETAEDGGVVDVRISAGPVGPKPMRLTKVERFLLGKFLDEQVIVQASAIAANVSAPRTSILRGEKWYRQYLVARLCERGLKELEGLSKADNRR